MVTVDVRNEDDAHLQEDLIHNVDRLEMVEQLTIRAFRAVHKHTMPINEDHDSWGWTILGGLHRDGAEEEHTWFTGVFMGLHFLGKLH